MILSPECPRCGYDQSGVADSWSNSCPLEGTCSECGLAFSWARIFRADRSHVPGFYEHARRRWNISWAWRTWSWCVLPWRFAARVKLEHRPRACRILLWLALVFVPVHLLASACRAGIDLQTLRLYALGPLRVTWWWIVNMIVEPVGFLSPQPGGVEWWWQINDTPFFLPIVLAMSLSVPPVLALLSATRLRTKVKKTHLLRHGVYGLAWLGPIAVLSLLDDIDRLLDLATSTVTPRRIVTSSWGYSYTYTRRVEDHPWMWLMALLVWFTAWWWWSIVKVLQLPRHVYAACMAIAALVGVIAGVAQLLLHAYGSLLY